MPAHVSTVGVALAFADQPKSQAIESHNEATRFRNLASPYYDNLDLALPVGRCVQRPVPKKCFCPKEEWPRRRRGWCAIVFGFVGSGEWGFSHS
ncbi:hypothetical protein WN943_007078 [Citrus x changshan-huyou]